MSGPKPQPMTGNPPPQEIPPSHPMGPVPAGTTHAIRLRYTGGWDTYGTYPSREAAVEEYVRLIAAGERASNIIICRV